MRVLRNADQATQALVRLRGTLPDDIQGGCTGAACHSIIRDEYSGQDFNLDDVVLYFADRHGIFPDLVKAQIHQESGERFDTHAIRYEPLTHDWKYFAGCDADSDLPPGDSSCFECLPGAVGCRRRLFAPPFDLYRLGGRYVDLGGDGRGRESAADFAELQQQIAPGLDQISVGTLVTGWPGNARFMLFRGMPIDDPYCIDQTIPACQRGASSYAEYGIRVRDHSVPGSPDWPQVAAHDHNIHRAGHTTVQPGIASPLDTPAGKFRVDYDSQAGEIRLGTPAPANLFLHVRPFYVLEEPASASSKLPTEADLNALLEWVEDGIGNPGGCIDYVVGQTIGSAPHDRPQGFHSGWVQFNVADDCGGLLFLCMGGGVDDHSQNFLILDRTNIDLYDPKYDDVTAQFVLSSSFGLMQTTILFMSEYDPAGLRFLDEEWDIRASGNDYLDLVRYPWRSVQAGTYLYKFKLYGNDVFPLAAGCGETCSRDDLLRSARAGLCRYNGLDVDAQTGGCSYVNKVFQYLDEYSTQLDRWGLP